MGRGRGAGAGSPRCRAPRARSPARPFDAARQLRLVATHLAGQFGVDTEVFEALAFQSFDEAAAGSGLRRDYLVVCVTALVSELLRAEGRRVVAGSA